MNSNEIAKIAGVSRSTVSRVINNYGNVPPETREKVLKVIKEYNYVPHASAQMLAGKKSKIVGLFIIDTKSEDDEYTNSYFTPFTSAVINTANKLHYNVLVSVINKSKDFKNIRDMFTNKTIFAGIFIGGKNYEPEIIEIIENGYKAAVIEQEIKGSDDPFSKCIVVNGDSFTGAYTATKYLIGLGHRNIAHICGDMIQYSAILRLEGYKKALNDSGIELNNKYIVKGNYTEESGYKAAKKLLSKERPTAIFIANDTMSIGAMKAIKELGLKIPEDISVIGYDDIELARHLQPALTTIKVSFFQMAFIATNDLIKTNEENVDFTANYKIPVELVERESCRKI